MYSAIILAGLIISKQSKVLKIKLLAGFAGVRDSQKRSVHSKLYLETNVKLRISIKDLSFKIHKHWACMFVSFRFDSWTFYNISSLSKVLLKLIVQLS